MTSKRTNDPEPTTYFQMAAATDPEVAAVSPSEIVGSATFSGYPASGTPTNDVRLGESVGNKATDSSKMLRKSADPVRKGSFPAGSVGAVKLGNELAGNVGGGGPGTGREVMRSGTQGQHGNANPGIARPGADKPIFPGFK
jgi:hypothetical protein